MSVALAGHCIVAFRPNPIQISNGDEAVPTRCALHSVVGKWSQRHLQEKGMFSLTLGLCCGCIRARQIGPLAFNMSLMSIVLKANKEHWISNGLVS